MGVGGRAGPAIITLRYSASARQRLGLETQATGGSEADALAHLVRGVGSSRRAASMEDPRS